MTSRPGQVGISSQNGVTLIEVLVAVLILGVGVLGVAMLQLNALKQTDSAMRSTQVSFIAQDLLERVRANPDANYALASLSEAPTSGDLANPRQQDLFDFADQLKRAAGEDVQASINVAGVRVTVSLDWNDSRAQGEAPQRRSMMLSSVLRPERDIQP